MNNFVQPGNTIEAIAPAGGVVTGVGVVIGTNIFGIPATTAAATVSFSLVVEGVFDLAKQAALAIAAGDTVYWDTAADEVDTTQTNVPIGVCVTAAAGGDATVAVKLDGRTHTDIGGPLKSMRLNHAGVADDIVPAYVVPPLDITVVAIKAIAKVSPGSAAGLYTLAVSSGADNLLVAATFDLESLTADTLEALTLTATTADLDIDADAPIEFSFVSDNADLVDGDVTLEVQYRDR